MENGISLEVYDWSAAINDAKKELSALKTLEMSFGQTLIILTREVILEEALKMYDKGCREAELYSLLIGR